MPGPVVVYGATGNVGAALVRRLVARGASVRAFFDPRSSPAAASPAGVDVHHGGFDDPAAVTAAAEGADAVFVLTPPSAAQVGWQESILRAAQQGGARRVVKLSAFETAADSPLQLGRWHHEGELALARLTCETVILRPQYFMQNLAPALREAVSTGRLRHVAAASTVLGLVDVEDVAAVAACALLDPGHDGAVLRPTGPRAVSLQQVAEALGAAIGREVRYDQRPEAETVAALRARGLPSWHIADVLRLNGEVASATVTSDVEAVTGHRPGTIEQFLDRLLQDAAARR